jgi:uncharacterized protein YegP (UPF0339 family)
VSLVLQVFEGGDGQWYWRIRQTSNRTTLATSEGYTRERDAVRAAGRLRDLGVSFRTPIEVDDPQDEDEPVDNVEPEEETATQAS